MKIVSIACALRSVLLKAELKKNKDKTRKNNRKTSLEDTNKSLTGRHDHPGLSNSCIHAKIFVVFTSQSIWLTNSLQQLRTP